MRKSQLEMSGIYIIKKFAQEREARHEAHMDLSISLGILLNEYPFPLSLMFQMCLSFIGC